MANEISAHGTLLKLGDGATPEVFTTVANVLDFDPPGVEQVHDDITSHSSSGWENTLPVLLRTGEVTFEIEFIPTGATHSYSAGLLKDAYNKTKRNFQVVFTDTGATTWSFSAYVQKFRPKAKVKGALRASVTLRGTGAPTLA